MLKNKLYIKDTISVKFHCSILIIKSRTCTVLIYLYTLRYFILFFSTFSLLHFFSLLHCILSSELSTAFSSLLHFLLYFIFFSTSFSSLLHFLLYFIFFSTSFSSLLHFLLYFILFSPLHSFPYSSLITLIPLVPSPLPPLFYSHQFCRCQMHVVEVCSQHMQPNRS